MYVYVSVLSVPAGYKGVVSRKDVVGIHQWDSDSSISVVSGVVFVSWRGASRNATLCLHFNAHGRALQPGQEEIHGQSPCQALTREGAKDLGCIIEVRR